MGVETEKLSYVTLQSNAMLMNEHIDETGGALRGAGKF